MQTSLYQKRERRVARARAKIFGTAKRPRLAVFRSSKHMEAQLIDDESGRTLVSASDLALKAKGTKTERAAAVGKRIAELAAKAKIRKAVFDRRGFKYHGRLAALATAARQEGLEF